MAPSPTGAPRGAANPSAADSRRKEAAAGVGTTLWEPPLPGVPVMLCEERRRRWQHRLYLSVMGELKDTTVVNNRAQVRLTSMMLLQLSMRMIDTRVFAERMADDSRRIIHDIVAPLPEDIRAVVLSGALLGLP